MAGSGNGKRRSAAQLAFLIVYNFLYYFIYLVLFAFLIVSPTDLIRQAAAQRENYNILIIALCYLITILIISFIYATRLYLNRSVIASIPKSWVPVFDSKGSGEDNGTQFCPRDVRQMIADGLSRSAALAYAARPRLPAQTVALPAVPGAVHHQQGQQGQQVPGMEGIGPKAAEKQEAKKRSLLWKGKLRRNALTPSETKVGATTTGASTGVINIIPDAHMRKPVWGEIEHPGWAPPNSPDLPNLQYDTVILELPNLIEAKAITLAPPAPAPFSENPDTLSPPAEDAGPTLDPEAVALLQRPQNMGLREYLGHLTELAVVAPSPMVSEFITLYERARFSTMAVANEEFRRLMHLFAEVLRGMQPFDLAVLDEFEDGGGSEYEEGSGEVSSRHASGSYHHTRASETDEGESDIDNDAPRGTSPSSVEDDADLAERENFGLRPREGSGSGSSTEREDGNSQSDVARNRGQKSRRSRNNHLEKIDTNKNNYGTTIASSPRLGEDNNFLSAVSHGRQVSNNSSSSSDTNNLRNSYYSTRTGGGSGGGDEIRRTMLHVRNSSTNTSGWQSQQQFRTAPSTPRSTTTTKTKYTLAPAGDALSRTSSASSASGNVFSPSQTTAPPQNRGAGTNRSRNRRTITNKSNNTNYTNNSNDNKTGTGQATSAAAVRQYHEMMSSPYRFPAPDGNYPQRTARSHNSSSASSLRSVRSNLALGGGLGLGHNGRVAGGGGIASSSASSTRSGASGTGSVVIRLAENREEEEGLGLPYVLMMGSPRGAEGGGQGWR